MMVGVLKKKWTTAEIEKLFYPFIDMFLDCILTASKFSFQVIFGFHVKEVIPMSTS
jgi:hypothetical protein